MNFTDAVRKSMQKFLDGDLSLKEQMLEDDEPTGKKKDDKDED